MFLGLACKALENKSFECHLRLTSMVNKAINLDLSIKLINEELTNVSERQAVQSQQILNYLSQLGKLMSHKIRLLNNLLENLSKSKVKIFWSLEKLPQY